jgi:flagellar motor switch/type III secretory pathway protein FliN
MPDTITADTPAVAQPTRDPWKRVMEVSCQLTVQLVVPGMRVREVVRLKPGSVVDTKWSLSTEVPLLANGQLIAWSEFEAVGERLAVRITELT